jgi:ABC-type amino acid transport substrate-binding protein
MSAEQVNHRQRRVAPVCEGLGGFRELVERTRSRCNLVETSNLVSPKRVGATKGSAKMFNASIVMLIALLALNFAPSSARAVSTLDKVVQSRVLRCGVTLDSPPSGFRTPANQPDGFDVAYCLDMAKALGAKPEIVETPESARIPALVSDRIDVLIASTTNTPARALAVAFSQPYMNYTSAVLTRRDTRIKTFADLKGRRLGGVTGTSTEQQLNKIILEWHDPKTSYTGYAGDAEAFLALQQGKVDAILMASVVNNALIASGQFPEFTSAGIAPTPPDLVSMAVKRDDQQFLNWVRLFIWTQVETGRFKELYNKYFGPGDVPDLTLKGVDY